MGSDNTSAPEPMDLVTKALALARLGIKVFPVSIEGRTPAIEGGNGFYDATSDDFEQIATWFMGEYSDHSRFEVGYWAGGSDLFVADIDTGKKNGKDGFKSIADRGLDVGTTHAYPSRSGGEHRVFQSNRVDLTLSQDHVVDGVKLEGVDIRAGGSYAVWWADTVPESREAFSIDIPAWMLTPKNSKIDFNGEGYSGSVSDWLEAIPDGDLPSGRVVDLMNRIPTGEFGHHEMIDLVWAIVRMGSERETGIKRSLTKLREAWLRAPYDTPKYRRDFDLAIRGAINKAGRVQKPVPNMSSLAAGYAKAKELGVAPELTAIENSVSETDTEIELARHRREMFKAAAAAGMSPGDALGVVTGSKAFSRSRASIGTAWFGDGEPQYHDVVERTELAERQVTEAQKVEEEIEQAKLLATLSSDSQAYSFLDEAEKLLVQSPAFSWFGTEYLAWVKTRLKHFNAPYHIGSMFSALSTIVGPWGKVPLPGADLTDCNLYVAEVGDSSTGKSEALAFGRKLIDAYWGLEASPIIGDISKLSALALHRALILRDGKPSFIYGDEIQSFFQGVQGSQWQNGILGDVSSHYGGEVSPKLTLNDKEISGKRARTQLTTHLTGIADQTLAAINLSHWTNGFFYRFLWGFGNPRKSGDYEIRLETKATNYTAQFDAWAREFKRVRAIQEMSWGVGRMVAWEGDAVERMVELKRQLDLATMSSPLHDSVYVNANGRFHDSMMKVCTIVAMSEASEKVTLRHVLIAIDYAGPWHRSMVLAVQETAKDPFEREVEKCLVWIKRNAVRQLNKPAVIQRSAVMRAFKPNEIADRLLRQLTEERWLIRSGDDYELAPEGTA